MAIETVLLTGGTGSIGAWVLEQLLSQGHKVIAVIRSLAKFKKHFDEKYATYLINGSLELVEVPDLAVPGVFDEPASRADAVIHVATPLTTSDFENTMIRATWLIDENILNAAKQSPKVKRVVISGSVVSVVKLPEGLFQDVVATEEDWNPITHKEGLVDLPNAYSYSKTSAEKQAWAWMNKEKPKFDLVVLLIPSVIGKSINPGFKPNKASLGGMSNAYSCFIDTPQLSYVFNPWMDVQDVAALHVRSATDINNVPGNERYLIKGPGVLDMNELANKIREEFPELRGRVPAPTKQGEGNLAPLTTFDTSKAQRVFGTESQFRDGWSSMKDTIADIARLVPSPPTAST
ncbi:uncharacterized protein Z519_01378 [Cladophialophora bantiana CBS 173.52]|uniref:NAD-dependent epimerase/dehydratase domain-containing protein n=1 Tax=Cladophialophora bantiana (strain ATCC 10958 / CBS 173.52 / CDC B-1940 / NIH 8579) TaxID=1442370 RepID=A0A0D2ILX8_CLAB1|nr:uncharacterized protein Z519_01378 [Cladophialophora bantiana CBS 173.52]KIW97794.1 hypothetical protein Z519_01378 [Cladophialophora bantiana CBS 173.52]